MLPARVLLSGEFLVASKCTFLQQRFIERRHSHSHTLCDERVIRRHTLGTSSWSMWLPWERWLQVFARLSVSRLGPSRLDAPHIVGGCLLSNKFASRRRDTSFRSAAKPKESASFHSSDNTSSRWHLRQPDTASAYTLVQTKLPNT